MGYESNVLINDAVIREGVLLKVCAFMIFVIESKIINSLIALCKAAGGDLRINK